MKKKITVFTLLVAMCTFMFGSLSVLASSGGVSIDTGEDSNKSNYYSMDYNLSFNFVHGAGHLDWISETRKFDFDFSSVPSDLKKYLFIEHALDANGNDMVYMRFVFVSPNSITIPYDFGNRLYSYNSDGSEEESEYSFTSNNSWNFSLKSGKDSGGNNYSYYQGASVAYYSYGTTADYSHTFVFDKIIEYPLEANANISSTDNFNVCVADTVSGLNDEYVIPDTPDIDPDTAEYVKDIGYLQNVKEDIYRINDADSVSANFKEVKYRVSWSEKTNTGFDVTQDNVYVSFYNQVLGYKQNLPFGSKQEVVGKKVFIDKVKGSDLAMVFYQTDINNKCSEDLAKLDYTPLLQTISRSDAEWFRIEVYHPDTGTYTYGGWVKIAEKGDGDESATTTTWEPDPDGGNDDVQDPDGGVGDGERTPGDSGDGSTEQEAEDNAKPIDTTAEFPFTDFVSILDALTDSIGKFPQLVAKVFSFLPSQFIGILVAGLAVVVICRVLGR